MFRRRGERPGRPAVATVKARLYRNKNILTCARRQCTRVTSTRLFASTVVRSVHLERVVLALAFALLAVRRTQVGCAFRKSAGSQSPSRLRNARCRLSGVHAIIAVSHPFVLLRVFLPGVMQFLITAFVHRTKCKSGC